jgi:hypothetical protein
MNAGPLLVSVSRSANLVRNLWVGDVGHTACMGKGRGSIMNTSVTPLRSKPKTQKSQQFQAYVGRQK